MVDFRELEAKASCYFLRHGESDGNNSAVIQGRLDLGLSPKGREQARRVAAWFAGRGIQAIYSSPLRRARETAEIVAEALGIEEVKNHEDLTELDTGIFTGLPFAELSSRHPSVYRRYLIASWEEVPGAERIAELSARAERYWAFLRGLLASSVTSVLSVTHSGFLQWLIKATLGLSSWMPITPVGNCGICQLRIDSRPKGEQRRYFCEWTRLNFQPAGPTPGDSAPTPSPTPPSA